MSPKSAAMLLRVDMSPCCSLLCMASCAGLSRRPQTASQIMKKTFTSHISNIFMLHGPTAQYRSQVIQVDPKSRENTTNCTLFSVLKDRPRQTTRVYSSQGNNTSESHDSFPETVIGRVMSSQANFVRIQVEETEGVYTKDPPTNKLLCVVRALLKKMKRRVLVGDRVRVVGIDWNDGRGMVEDVLPRTSKLEEPPVANISRVMLVFSLAMPPFLPSAATRYLVAAEHAGLPVTVVLNKCDLISEEDMGHEVSRMQAWGYDCVAVSVETQFGMEALEKKLQGDITVVAGPSGAGKSSIINSLSLRSGQDFDANEIDLQAVGNVSERIGRGKHTTRNVTIIQLSAGGTWLVDTPGFNQPSLAFPPNELEGCFPEIRQRIAKQEQDDDTKTCAFKNCKHLHEPGCIVRGDWERYSLYSEIYSELETIEQIQAKRAMTKRRREGTVRHKKAAGGVLREEARLETKSHRRTSRRSVKQEISEIARDPTEADGYEGSHEII